MHHQPKIVQWPPISSLLKSLGLDIYTTSPLSATRAVVQRYDVIYCMCGWRPPWISAERDY